MLQYMDFLRTSVLQPTDGIRAVGLAYHVTDVFLPELARVVSEGSSKPPQGEILEVLLQPFVDALVAAGEAAPIRRLRSVGFVEQGWALWGGTEVGSFGVSFWLF